MKRYYYNNWLAKVLLHFSTCHTIAVGWFVLSKLTEGKTSQYSRNHETIHAMQWTEITLAIGVLIFICMVIFDLSPWWMITSMFFYYLWYVIEWLIKLPFGNAYRSISFEQEAYTHQQDENYVENRKLYDGWISKVFKIKGG